MASEQDLPPSSTSFYRCTLEACVWTTDSNAKPVQPHLRFWYNKQLVAEIYLRMDDLRGHDRWMLRMYPVGGEAYLPPQEEEGHRSYGVLYRPPRRLEPLLERGEERFPRDSAAAAIKLAVEKFGEEMSRSELEGVTKVAEMLRPVLERLTINYVTRFRPARTAPPKST
jgi:hypothetical protein